MPNDTEIALSVLDQEMGIKKPIIPLLPQPKPKLPAVISAPITAVSKIIPKFQTALNKPVKQVTIPDLPKIQEIDINVLKLYENKLNRLKKIKPEELTLSVLQERDEILKDIDFHKNRQTIIQKIISGEEPISSLPSKKASELSKKEERLKQYIDEESKEILSTTDRLEILPPPQTTLAPTETTSVLKGEYERPLGYTPEQVAELEKRRGEGFLPEEEAKLKVAKREAERAYITAQELERKPDIAGALVKGTLEFLETPLKMARAIAQKPSDEMVKEAGGSLTKAYIEQILRSTPETVFSKREHIEPESFVTSIHQAYPEFASEHPYIVGGVATVLDIITDPLWGDVPVKTGEQAVKLIKLAEEKGVAFTRKNIPVLKNLYKQAEQTIAKPMTTKLEGGFAGIPKKPPYWAYDKDTYETLAEIYKQKGLPRPTNIQYKEYTSFVNEFEKGVKQNPTEFINLIPKNIDEKLTKELILKRIGVPPEVLKDYPELAKQVKPTPAITKELWQMTEKEFNKVFPIPAPGVEYIFSSGEKIKLLASPERVGLGRLWKAKNLSTGKIEKFTTAELNKRVLGVSEATTHRGIIYDALMKDKPVPPEIIQESGLLKDLESLPELSKKLLKPTPTIKTGSTELPPVATGEGKPITTPILEKALVEEAKKYKTADKFVKSKSDWVKNPDTVPVTKEYQNFLDEYKRLYSEAETKSQEMQKILDKYGYKGENDPAIDVSKISKKDISKFTDLYNERKKIWSKATLLPTGETPITTLGGSKAVESQLTDIWNKAHEVKTTPIPEKPPVSGLPPIPSGKAGKRSLAFEKYGVSDEMKADLEDRMKILGYEKYQIKSHGDTQLAAQELGVTAEQLASAKRILSREELTKLSNSINTEANNIKKIAEQIQKTPLQKETLGIKLDAAEYRLNQLIKKAAINSTETAQALEAHRILAQQTLEPQFWLTRASKIAGRDITDKEISIILELLNTKDRVALANFVSMLRDASWSEKAITIWKAGLLTSPTTHIANTSGNITMLGLETIKDIPAIILDKLISVVTGKRSVIISPKTIWAKTKAIPSAIKKSGKFLKSGIYEMDIISKYDIPKQVRFKNPLLNLYTQSVFRSLGVEDILFREIALQESLVKQAEVLSQKLKGKKYKKAMKSLLLNPTDEMVAQAIRDAEYVTFQSKNPLADMISGAKKSLRGQGAIKEAGYIGLEILTPFVKTPTNVAMRIADYTPIGFVKALLRLTKPSALTQKAFIEDISRGLTGSGIIALGSYLASQGLLTGNPPTNKAERDMFYAEGKQANSIKLFGRWWSLNRTSPAGNLMGIGANYHEMSKEKEGIDLIIGTVASGIKGLTEQTFLKGISGGLAALTDPERSAEKFLEQTISSIIPSVIGRTGKTEDPYLRKTEGIKETLQERIPFLRKKLPVRRDIFGEPVEVPGGRWTLIDPFASKKAKDEPIIKEARQLDIRFGMPSEKVSGIKLNGYEYDRYSEALGKARKQILTELINSDFYPELEAEQKKKIFEKALDRAKEEIDALFYPQLMMEKYQLNEDDISPAFLKKLLSKISQENDKFNKLTIDKQKNILKERLLGLGIDIDNVKFVKQETSKALELLKSPERNDTNLALELLK